MGDRGNIAVIQDNERKDQIFLYSHWGGSDMWLALQAGLRAFPGRLTDESYITRIIHEQTLSSRPEDFRGETGHGISCRLTDNEYPILVFNIPKQEVFIIMEAQLTEGRQVPVDFVPNQTWTVEQYLALKADPRLKPPYRR